MDTESKHLDRLLASLRRSERRSVLFHWLAQHHDQILEAAAGDRMDWRTVAAQLKEAGLTDATGKPATARTARATWYKVRQWVASRRAGGASPRRPSPPPSKLSKDVRPLAAENLASPQTAPLRATGAGGWPTGSAAGPPQSQSGPASDRRLTAAERTERLKQQLQSRNY